LLITFRTHPRQVMQAAYQPQLLTTYDEKCELLTTTGADYCLTLDFTTALAALSARRFMVEILKEKLSVKVLIIGYDHRFGHDRSEGFAEYVEYGRELGMEVVRADAFAMSEVNVSSSMVRACLAEGEVGMAARCLTRPYEITGRVVHGFHVGHELGFPTANIQVEDAQKLIPKNGVYAVWVKGGTGGEEHVWGGMLNIGLRPTMENGENRTIEVHLLDFAGDLYGCCLMLSFVRRLRDEKKFRNKGDLVHQLREDEAMVRMILNKEQ
jgi:riboflavin kinase/FMN adenylyltransferase